MQKVKNIDKKILRVIDANFNRSKEGLRVIEDIFRFILEDDQLRKKIRRIRHVLDKITKENFFITAVTTRDPHIDLGRKPDKLEIKRKDCYEVLYANLQRVKESLRVLEEFFKLIAVQKVPGIKKLRYEIYNAEKQIFLKNV